MHWATNWRKQIFPFWENKLSKQLSIKELVHPPTLPISSQSGIDGINTEAPGNRWKEEAPGNRWKEEIEFIYKSVNKTTPPKPRVDIEQEVSSQAEHVETQRLQSQQSFILGI